MDGKRYSTKTPIKRELAKLTDIILWFPSGGGTQSKEPGRNEGAFVRMNRHRKKCTAGAVYTYPEEQEHTAASGYQTQIIPMGQDAVKDVKGVASLCSPARTSSSQQMVSAVYILH